MKLILADSMGYPCPDWTDCVAVDLNDDLGMLRVVLAF